MMICPQCGATYPDASVFCANDGTPLLPGVAEPQPGQVQPAEPQYAPGYAPQYAPDYATQLAPQTAWQTPTPVAATAAKSKGGLIALVLAIALVVAIGVGAFLFFRNKTGGSGGSGGLAVTGTAPTYTDDWTRGVTQSWQRGASDGTVIDGDFGSILLMTTNVWVLSTGQYPDMGADAVNADTGAEMWHIDFGQEATCTNTVQNGQWACVYNTNGTDELHMIDVATGKDVQTLDLTLAEQTSQGVAAWTDIWFADGALIMYGNGGSEESYFVNLVTRVTLSPLAVAWSQDADAGCPDSGQVIMSPTNGGMINRNTARITGDVLWGTEPMDLGPNAFAVDIRDGKPIFAQKGTCDPAQPLSADTYLAGSGAPSGKLPLPGGGSINIVSDDSLGAISYADSQLPDVPVFFQPDGSVSDELGVSPVSGNLKAAGANWQLPILMQQVLAAGGGADLQGVVDGNTLVVAGDQGQVEALDPTTGQVLWNASVPALHDQSSDSSAGVAIVGDVVAVSTNGWSGNSSVEQVTLLSLASGAQVWQGPGQAVVSPDRTMLAIVTGDYNSPINVSRYVPNTEAWKNPPVDAPSCPYGMTPVSWTKYSDGSVLVCSGDGKYDVVSSQGWSARQLDWTDGGFTVTFSNGNIVNAYLGGSFVDVTQGGQVTSYVASESWIISSGPSSFADSPSGVPGCPSNTYPISLSTWNGGWLLVCGTDASSPTSLSYSDGSTQGQASSVKTVPGGYCSDAQVGQVCVYSSPAVVSIGGTQHSVDSNYFASSGGGGAGQGTGSYGVPAPDPTAQAQVQYLVGILNSSAATRTSLGQPSQDVDNCQDLPDAVAQIQVVAQNRQDLMTALNSAPVDHIPNGTQLVAQLQAALQASYNNDEAFINWGQAQQSSGCSQMPQDVTDTNTAAGNAKDAFCNTWNSQIAPTYNVPAFTTDQI